MRISVKGAITGHITQHAGEREQIGKLPLVFEARINAVHEKLPRLFL